MVEGLGFRIECSGVGGRGGGGLLWNRMLGLGLVKSYAACYCEAENRWNRELRVVLQV